ncbi:DUF1345 domain-containing protein [Massilia sp. S19_KUP03_FR1]|uniref:DUF1345 domain-containing protein n=1 Tax=Massilia sp. S19_KUP03_FR1 TaxID=3025503 RepID=UPI002FCD4839
MPKHKPLAERTLLHRFVSSRPYLTVALLVGVASGLFFHDETALRQALIGWNVTVWLYLLIIIYPLNKADHHRVRELAARQDESAALVLVTMTIGIALTMAAVISELASAGKGGDGQQALHYIITAVTVTGSWLLLGVLYCFHYAHMFYNSDSDQPELKFPDDEKEPNYWDFLYFSFTISVAVQTSDVCVMSRAMRKLVLSQSVICYLFNLVIVGLAINIAAGLMNN